MDIHTWTYVGWLIAACALGFVITFVFAGLMKLSRNIFLIPYVLLVGVFLYAFAAINRIDLGSALMHNWVGGIAVGVLLSIFLVFQVRSQPASRQENGATLALDVTWAGLIYGLTDGLFLNVMPVVAVWGAISQFGWAESPIGQVTYGVLGLLASIAVSMAYHVGYPEFRGERMRFAVIGPGLITLAYLLSGNPLSSIISHTAMHIAAVLQGAETTVQLPPHYQTA